MHCSPIAPSLDSFRLTDLESLYTDHEFLHSSRFSSMTNLTEALINARSFIDILAEDHLILTLDDMDIAFEEMNKNLWGCLLERPRLFMEDIVDAEIAILFSAFRMALIPFLEGVSSLLHEFLLRVIRVNKENWLPNELYKNLQNNFKQAVSEECANMWVVLINKRLKKNWKPKELYKDFQNNFKQQQCADMWAAYFVGQALRYKMDDDRALGWLEKGYALSNNLVAKVYVSQALYKDTLMTANFPLLLHHCEKLKRSAMELQSKEYIFYSLIYSFIVFFTTNVKEAQKKLQDMQMQLNQTESVYQEYFFRGMAMSLHAQLLFHHKGNCEEATVNIKRGLELLKLVLNDPVYELKTYINSPIAPSLERLWLTKEWIQTNEERLYTASPNISSLEEALASPNNISSLEKALDFAPGFANENPVEATVWANELVQKFDGCNLSIAPVRAFEIYIEVIYTTCRDENGLLSAEGLGKIEVVFNKLFLQQNMYYILALKYFVIQCWRAAAYDVASELLLKNMHTLMEVGFDDNSEARMSHFESTKDLFRFLEHTLFASGYNKENVEDAKKAVIWSERGKARDLAYMINTKYGRETYQYEFCKFDVDDAHAWNEIQSICSLAGPHTAFLVLSKIFDTNIDGYFLYAAEEPFLMHLKLPKGFITCSDGLDLCLERRLRKFKNRKLHEDMFDRFISPWKRKMQMTNNNIIEKLVIVPSEDLSVLPFAALHDRDDGKYLIQSYAISSSPSLRLFQHCEMRRRLLCEIPSPGLKALVVGNPTLDNAFLDLPFAEEEADIAVSALCDAGYDCDGIKLLKKEAATREEVLDGLSSFDWIHIASHAIVDAKHPRGAILLASAIPQEHHAPNYHGRARQEGPYERAIREHLISSKSILEPDEIIDQEKLNARGVILSACNSALGEICADGILGLCRSFHISGVPTIVASLWKVDDEATKVLMAKCYQNLKTGMEMVFALQEAIKFMIEEDDDFGNPRFDVDDWAPFIVSGTSFTILCEFPSEVHA